MTFFINKMEYNRLLYIEIFVVLLIVVFESCNNQINFDKHKWNERTDIVFPSSDRNLMIKDLTTKHKLVGLSCSQLVDYIGSPDHSDGKSLIYNIIVKYDGDIDPVYTKNLEFTFSKDSVITSFKIMEWKK